MTTTHTPGPWSYRKAGRISWIQTDAPRAEDDLMILPNAAGVSDPNARLIAAAPDLLEALKTHMVLIAAHAAEFARQQPSKWEESNIKRNLEAARAAIAKAEGV